MTKRVRWECPEHGGAILAPTRLRKIDVRRYCLPCSEKAGVLVERFAPTLEKQRQKRAEAQKTQRQKAAARKVEKECARFVFSGYDVREVVFKLSRLEHLGGPRGRMAKDPPVIWVRWTKHGPMTILGRAWPWENRIQVTAWEGVTLPFLMETIVHELAHIKVGRTRDGQRDGWHGRKFRAVNIDAYEEAKKKFPQFFT